MVRSDNCGVLSVRLPDETEAKDWYENETEGTLTEFGVFGIDPLTVAEREI